MWRGLCGKADKGPLRVRSKSRAMMGDDVTKDLEDQPRHLQEKTRDAEEKRRRRELKQSYSGQLAKRRIGVFVVLHVWHRVRIL